MRGVKTVVQNAAVREVAEEKTVIAALFFSIYLLDISLNYYLCSVHEI